MTIELLDDDGELHVDDTKTEPDDPICGIPAPPIDQDQWKQLQREKYITTFEEPDGRTVPQTIEDFARIEEFDYPMTQAFFENVNEHIYYELRAQNPKFPMVLAKALVAAREYLRAGTPILYRRNNGIREKTCIVTAAFEERLDFEYLFPGPILDAFFGDAYRDYLAYHFEPEDSGPLANDYPTYGVFIAELKAQKEVNIGLALPHLVREKLGYYLWILQQTQLSGLTRVDEYIAPVVRLLEELYFRPNAAIPLLLWDYSGMCITPYYRETSEERTFVQGYTLHIPSLAELPEAQRAQLIKSLAHDNTNIIDSYPQDFVQGLVWAETYEQLAGYIHGYVPPEALEMQGKRK